MTTLDDKIQIFVPLMIFRSRRTAADDLLQTPCIMMLTAAVVTSCLAYLLLTKYFSSAKQQFLVFLNLSSHKPQPRHVSSLALDATCDSSERGSTSQACRRQLDMNDPSRFAGLARESLKRLGSTLIRALRHPIKSLPDKNLVGDPTHRCGEGTSLDATNAFLTALQYSSFIFILLNPVYPVYYLQHLVDVRLP